MMTLIMDYLDKLNLASSAAGSNYYTFFAEFGRKYTKIIYVGQNGLYGRGVHAFVDRDGNVYKPASWKAPAKHIRFNLRDLDTVDVDPYGAYLYMR
jgi:hypothetical protein